MVVDLSRLHYQARVALEVQERVPLTRGGLAAVRRSILDATPAEVGVGPTVDVVDDLDADGVPVRLYRDGDDTDRPVMLFLHGGGWVMGNVDTHDGLSRHLAAGTGWAVLSVDYRLAPEHPYPAALDDTQRVLAWVRRGGAARYRLDHTRIALAGDSAGGHLAAVLARRARDAGLPVAAQVLICPVLDPRMDYPDLDDYGLHRDEMRFFWAAYAPPGTDLTSPDLDPLRADLAGLPPAVIITAELDVLRDEAHRYADALLAARVPAVCVQYQGLNHNFVRKLALFDAAHAAIAQIGAMLHRYVDGGADRSG